MVYLHLNRLLYLQLSGGKSLKSPKKPAYSFGKRQTVEIGVNGYRFNSILFKQRLTR